METLETKPKIDLIVQIRDKNGNIIKEIKKEDDPLVRWALRNLVSRMAGYSTTVKDESGAMRTSHWYSGYGLKWAGKIAIGLDPTPSSFEDFKLGAKERETSSLTVTPYSETNSSGSFEIKYDFLIEVEKTYYEFGLFAYNYDGNSYFYHLISRDVISAGVTVPANSYLTVIYRIILGSV